MVKQSENGSAAQGPETSGAQRRADESRIEVRIAEGAGFCMGVKRALKLALRRAANSDGPIYTLGPLIHNQQVVAMLAEKGIEVLGDDEKPRGGIVIVRAHGVRPERKRAITDTGAALCDATCPRVEKVQITIMEHARRGYHTVIVGDAGHPEVVGLLGYTGGRGFVIDRAEMVADLPPMERVCVVAQTTQNRACFQEIAAALGKRYPGCAVFDTICNFTSNSQQKAVALAQEVDLMVVVGGYHSGNTQRLANLCRQTGTPTVHVEGVDELTPGMFRGCRVIGMAAGASTPEEAIEQVAAFARGLQTGA